MRVCCTGSDGQLFSVELPTREPEQFPGRSLATLAFISHRHPAAILPLSPTHVAVYGADASEEGMFICFKTIIRLHMKFGSEIEKYLDEILIFAEYLPYNCRMPVTFT